MKIDPGHETTGEGDRVRRTLNPPARAGAPAQAQGPLAYSPAPDSVEQGGGWGSNVLRGPKGRIGEAQSSLLGLPAGLRRLGYYGLALALVALGVIMRAGLTHLVGQPGLPTYLTFYPVVMLAALLGGWGPGLVAILATAVVADYWLLLPAGLFKIESRVDLVGLAFFGIVGMFVSVVAELYRRLRGHLEDLVVVRTAALSRANEQLRAQAQELQVQSEELAELAQSLTREKEILQSVMNGAKNSHLVYLDRDFNFVRANATYARSCGYTPEEMIGRNHFVLYPHAENEAIFSRVRDTGEPVEFHDKPFVFPDQPQRGTTYWDWTLLPVKNEAGRVEGLVFSLFETTQRKQAQEALRTANEQLQKQAEELQTQAEELQAQTEELMTANEGLREGEQALRESEEKYRRIVETATEAIVMVDANARIVFVNDRWSEIFGYNAEEARHMTHFELVFPEDMTLMKKRWESRQRGRKESYEFRLRRRDGSPVWVLMGVAPRFGPEGESLGTLVMAADITKRKKAEEALRELNAKLESKVAERTEELEHRAWQLQKLSLELTEAEERERKRLAQILHDDLQQVLAAAKFHVSILGSRTKTDAALQKLTGQVNDLLNDALDKSRHLSHELSAPVLADSDLSKAFEWLAQQMQTQHGFRIHLDVRERIEVASEPLRVLLYKAAQELLFNAIKHAGVREATLRLRHRRGRLWLSVSDKGHGFDSVHSDRALGFGLLSIRERVGFLGGRMKIRSARGKGSTFLVAVPDSDARDEE